MSGLEGNALEASGTNWKPLARVDGKLGIHSCFKTSIGESSLDWKMPSLHDGFAAVPDYFPIIIWRSFLPPLFFPWLLAWVRTATEEEEGTIEGQAYHCAWP